MDAGAVLTAILGAAAGALAVLLLTVVWWAAAGRGRGHWREEETYDHSECCG